MWASLLAQCKESACSAGGVSSIPGWRRSCGEGSNARGVSSIPGWRRSCGEGKGNSLQYSCLENSHGQRSLAGYSPWGWKKVEHNLVTKQLTIYLCSQQIFIECLIYPVHSWRHWRNISFFIIRNKQLFCYKPWMKARLTAWEAITWNTTLGPQSTST